MNLYRRAYRFIRAHWAVIHLVSAATCLSLVAWVMLGSHAPAHAARISTASGQLVYICQSSPCANNQQLEVFDKYGNPIFSVPAYGGPGVFGDNFQLYAPGTVFHPAVTISYESPGAYDSQHGLGSGCTAPSRWIEPRGVWTCQSGQWVRQ